MRMLDTIALTLQQHEFDVLHMDVFSPSARGLYQPPYYKLGGRANFSCYQNPTKTELKNGVYKPRLTLTKRQRQGGYSITLRIEFSAPKLLRGNNFDELQDNDLPELIDTLHAKLIDMGITVQRDTLCRAKVSGIHYSKNTALRDFSTCSMIMGELSKGNVSQRMDLAHTDYRNEGHALRFHCNSYQIIWYDKLKDLAQSRISEKRAIERDSVMQQDLFADTELPRELQVLRMEVRLGTTAKIRSLLRTLNISAELTLNSLFNQSIAQTVLMHFWRNATTDMPLLALCNYKPEDIMQALIAEGNGEVKIGKLLQQLGGLMLIGSVGMRGAKSLLADQCAPRTWQRIRTELEGLDITANMKYGAIRAVEQQLCAFEPLRVEDYVIEGA